jgi:hypothetical protein
LRKIKKADETLRHLEVLVSSARNTYYDKLPRSDAPDIAIDGCQTALASTAGGESPPALLRLVPTLCRPTAFLAPGHTPTSSGASCRNDPEAYARRKGAIEQAAQGRINPKEIKKS